MKNSILKSTFVTVVFLTFCGGFYLRHANNEKNSDLFLENVEALTEDGETTQKCTRAIEFEQCYQTITYYLPNGTMVTQKIATHMRITAVEEYEVEKGSPVICMHDHITSC